MYRKWRPSKTAAREFAQKMEEIDEFCAKNGIHASKSKDSYYFTVRGVDYRVSNHSIEASNRNAFSEDGEQLREVYHEGGRRDDVVYIHAGKRE